ncbi:sensor histidine kinase [Yinghuangia seranimata]|uniref:sensor histidine kinase n=1 Tax=Yinghuangia seranimata TaxID=408067 RepID=UPI00248CCD25|nr:HAMP domain-containing sensor histidine kinase [Yinghuangia seranimata]MDI2131994.1 HAMP domain-containing sensor histidine kinase [Yinghuangia seranimata]
MTATVLRPLRRPFRRLATLPLRARLALVYGGLFLIAGVVLLGATYALVSARLPGGDGVLKSETAGPGAISGPSNTETQPGVKITSGTGPDGEPITNKMESARSETLNVVLTQGGIALVVVCAVATGFGWLIAGRMLQPLQRMTETALRVADAPDADRRLHERIALDGPDDEIKKLADTFDRMLERLDHSFDGQRRFIANASHELRTPLALNQALLEVVVFRRDAGPEVRQLGETLLEINARHERLIDGLLLLTRSEHELQDRAFVDMADIVEHVATQLPPGKAAVEVDAAEATTTGNPVLLERLVQNLVENGVRYNLPEDGWVRVRSRTAADGSAVVTVSNTGPVVPKYEVPGLFEPFRRLGTERLATASPGAGLGLSIVRAVARSHGGDVRAEPREGGGLDVTVTLPPAPPE